MMAGPLERIIIAVLLFIVVGVPFLVLLVVGTVLLIKNLRSDRHDDLPTDADETIEKEP